MKKGIVVLLLVLAFVVIVSPKIVGHLAERSVNENLNWAADSSGELMVASEGFDRGWFSSQGQHRIELGEGNWRNALETLVDSGDQQQLPALLIDTHIDHGLIPVSSMSRDGGSLSPGLGSAVSTLIFESADGEQIELPGKILSSVGLGGNVESNYVLDAGSQDVGDGSVSWQPTNIEFAVDPNTGESEYEGQIGALTFSESGQSMSIDNITFSGEQLATQYGFSIGEINVEMGAFTVQAGGQNTGLQSFSLQSKADTDDGVVESSATLNMTSQTIPGFGEISIDADINSEVDAVAAGALSRALKGMPGGADPMQLLSSADAEIKGLLAGGLSIDFERFDVTLPMGEVESEMHFSVPKTDAANFDYTSLLLSAVADVDIKVPEALVDMAVAMNPQAGMIVGMGYLKKNGDTYELNAQMKKGLLTLNGAPIPLPFGAMR